MTLIIFRNPSNTIFHVFFFLSTSLNLFKVNPFPHIDAFWWLFDGFLMAFWKHSDKRRNCSKQAISPFSTMFSTFSHNLFCWQNMFKVVCCRIVVWGKGLIFGVIMWTWLYVLMLPHVVMYQETVTVPQYTQWFGWTRIYQSVNLLKYM